jgi:hypothetical protein
LRGSGEFVGVSPRVTANHSPLPSVVAPTQALIDPTFARTRDVDSEHPPAIDALVSGASARDVAAEVDDDPPPPGAIDFDLTIDVPTDDEPLPVAFRFASVGDAESYLRATEERGVAAVVRVALDRGRMEPTTAGATRDHPSPTAERPGSDQKGAARTRVTEKMILDDVLLVERVARRLRRFVSGLVTRTIEVVPAPPPVIDDATREKARRALARSGFVRVTK